MRKRANLPAWMADLKETLGRRIAELRKAAGLSQSKLAHLLGAATHTISQIERGKSAPPVSRLAAFAAVLGVEVRDLFTFDAPPSAPRKKRGAHDAVIARFAALIRRRPVDEAEATVDALGRWFRRYPSTPTRS